VVVAEPDSVITLRITVPADPGGVIARHCVLSISPKINAGIPPNVISIIYVRLVPVIIILVFPLISPDGVSIEVIVGIPINVATACLVGEYHRVTYLANSFNRILGYLNPVSFIFA
jgi:hypothetical protein